MLPPDGSESVLRSYFRQHQIAEIADLFHLLGTRLRMSVFRRLKAIVSTNAINASRPLYAGWKPGLTLPGWLRGKLRSGLAASPAPDNCRVKAAERCCRRKDCRNRQFLVAFVHGYSARGFKCVKADDLSRIF